MLAPFFYLFNNAFIKILNFNQIFGIFKYKSNFQTHELFLYYQRSVCGNTIFCFSNEDSHFYTLNSLVDNFFENFDVPK